jgi:hypothetical protein
MRLKYIKKIFFFCSICILVISFFSFSFVNYVRAQTFTGVPFGGLDDFTVPCTCTAGALFWHFFAPLYLSTSIPLTGAFAAPPTPVAFSNYNLRPSVWALGTYVPAGGAACFIGVTPYCIPLPNLGLITPFTGTSLTP